MKKNLFSFALICLTSFANAQWQQTSLDSVDVRGFVVQDTNIFTGAYGDGVFLSSNDGDTWTNMNNGLANTNLCSIAKNGNNLYAGIWSGLSISNDNGNSWSTLTTYWLTSGTLTIAFSGTNIFVGTTHSNLYDNGGYVMLSPDSGNTWTGLAPWNSGENGGVRSIIISGANIFVGTDGVGIALSTDNGTTWNVVNTGITNNRITALIINGNNIFAGTYGGGVFISSDNGNNWVDVNTGLTKKYVRSFATYGPDIFVGTDSGGVYVSSNNGALWTMINSGLPNKDIQSLAITNTKVFAGTNGLGVWELPLSEVGIVDFNKNDGKIILYPNPAKGNLTIESLQKSSIEILNIQGQIILQQQIPLGKIDIDISGLANGIYILRLTSNEKTELTRIIKE